MRDREWRTPFKYPWDSLQRPGDSFIADRNGKRELSGLQRSLLACAKLRGLKVTTKQLVGERVKVTLREAKQ